MIATAPSTPGPLSILSYPYTRLEPFRGGRQELKDAVRGGGSAILWRMGRATTPPEAELLRTRPGGVALLVVLPPVSVLDPSLVHRVQPLRPAGILPFHEDLHPVELSHVLRRPPVDLAVEVTDYLAWRGIQLDHDTVRIVRRIVELSDSLRSVSALARSMYMSRRALGRRFLTLGLPVPSHWLQMARLLRMALRLQNSDASVFSVAYELGYPDGFSVSNQMSRLFGHRPTEARERLGWEWLLEAWLRREAEGGTLAPTARATLGVGETPPPFVPTHLRRPVRAHRSLRAAS